MLFCLKLWVVLRKLVLRKVFIVGFIFGISVVELFL